MEHTSAAPISGSAQRLLSFRSSVANPTVKLLWCLSFTPIPFKSQWREGENSQVLTTSKRTNKNPLPWNPFQSLHFIFLSSREEGIYFTTLWVNKYWLDVFFFPFGIGGAETQPGFLLVLTQTWVNTAFLQRLQFGELYHMLSLLKWGESKSVQTWRSVFAGRKGAY